MKITENVWTHMVNYSQRDSDKGQKRFPWNGAFWLHWKCKSVHIEWSFFNKSFSIGTGLKFGNEKNTVFNIDFLIGSLYFCTENVLPTWFMKRFERIDHQREISVCLSLGGYPAGWLRWNVWTDPDSWHSTTPKWRDGSFNFVDFLLGDYSYNREIIKVYDDVIIPLPEKNYHAQISELIETWSRPRWPFKHSRRCYSLDMPEGTCIPFPGKGENSWDCGDDGICSCGCEGKSLADIIAHTVKTVIENRIKYGGEDAIC